MKLSKFKYTLFLLIALGCSACSVTRNIPNGSYFVQSVKIDEDKSIPKNDRLTSDDLENYIRQTPNKRFFGTNFYAWVYNQANPNSDNAWNRFLRQIGERPVILDNMLTQKSNENLEIYMRSQGYYSSISSYEVDTTSRKKRAKITYKVEQGEPYRIDEVRYIFRDSLLEPVILPDTANSLIHTGDIFNATVLDKERERITRRLRQEGYFNFTVGNIEYLADTLQGNNTADLSVIIKKYLSGYDQLGNPIMESSTRFIVSDVSVTPDFDPTIIMNDTSYLSKVDTAHIKGLNVVYQGDRSNVRGSVLRQYIPLKANTFYNSETVDQTYQDLMSMGYFKSAKVSFAERPAADIAADSVYQIVSKRDTTTFTSQSPIGYLDCNILCTAALRQSFNIELEGSTTSSFYGLSATAGYQNRNIFRGAEAFDISFTAGYEYMKAPEASKKLATEYGINTGLSFPRFLIPFSSGYMPWLVQPRTKLQLSVNLQDRPYYQRTLSSATWSYTWRNNGSSNFSLTPININVIDMGYLDPAFEDMLQTEYLKESYETLLIAGLSFGYTFNNQLKRLDGNATMLNFNFESSGNSINGAESLLKLKDDNNNNESKIFGIKYAQYLRSDINLSHKIALFPKVAIAGRIYTGIGYAYGNSSTLPIDRMFYAGGSNSMRGWTPRTLGPGSVPMPKNDIYPSQVGDLKLEANLELRFPVWNNFHGAVFLDAGNVWYLKENVPESIFHLDSFYKQLGLNTGVGLRLDVTFAILRLDWGLQMHNPNLPVGERWIKRFNWDYTALNFGVGYPF